MANDKEPTNIPRRTERGPRRGRYARSTGIKERPEEQQRRDRERKRGTLPKKSY